MTRPKLARNLIIPVIVSAAAILGAGPMLARAEPVQFNRDVRPILSDKCFQCHGFSETSRKAGLRLDTEDGMQATLETGNVAVVRGELDQSELVRRIAAADPAERMPPPESNHELSAAEIDILKRWVAEGAVYQGHWSFITPNKLPLPAVQDTAWPKSPIDYFVLAGLERQGLKPAPQADKRTLIRRVTFDLTGLPPTLEEIAAFEADTSLDAYAKLVDRLLTSDAYGEHQARYWLDAARYGDTHGLHLDNYREMWPYRDWVINAFNQNKPFDQFTIEQLAGDLLPNATIAQQVATGFCRCNISTSEGGSIPEEVEARNMVDRVETTASVFMGVTFGCCVCHNHKYDPLTSKDFYSMYAFFNSLDGSPLDGNVKDHPPNVKYPTPEQESRLAELARQITAAEQEIAAREAAAEPDFLAWLDKVEAQPAGTLLPTEGLLAHLALDEGTGTTAPFSNKPDSAGNFQGDVQWVEGKFGKAVKFGNDGYIDLGDLGRFERTQSFSYGAWVRTDGNVGGGTPLARMDDANGFRGWDLYVAGKRVAMHLIHAWPSVAVKVTTSADVLTPNQWHHLFVTYDGSSKASGVTVYVDGKPQPVNVDQDSLTETTITDTPLRLGRRNPGSAFTGGEVDDVRMFERQLSAEEVAALAGSDGISPLLAIARASRTAEQTKALFRHFIEHVDQPSKDAQAKLAGLKEEQKTVTSQVATTLVYKDKPEEKPTFILVRGQYDHPGEQVTRATPAVLPPMASDAPKNRLGFAQWLVSAENPLTSRVTVNRFWQQMFGAGIVRTTEDFGSQGEWPTHPELLDYLAVDFRESGWDIKQLFKSIAMSATYQQSSALNAELLRLDPQNRLLARGPRYRLDAEMLRDQALSLSGLLVRHVGGPSVKPPQPSGIWEAVGYTTSDTAKFTPDSGDKLYRRSVYTFWKRTAPPPTMVVFDAPSRESCRLRRERTNTPLQALAMLNETQWMEAARQFASHVLKRGGDSPESQLRFMFESATGRPPSESETAQLLQLQQELMAIYSSDAEAAKSVASLGDSPADPTLDPVTLASWTLVANTILNLDEVLTKE